MNRPFNVHLLIDTRINPDAYGLPMTHATWEKSKIRLYKLHQTAEFNYGWDAPNELHMWIEITDNRSMTKAEYKQAWHNYREAERERDIDTALSHGVKR